MCFYLSPLTRRKLSFFVACAVIAPADKVLPARLNMDIITVLQKNVAPGVFTPPAVYDGRKNLFAIREILGVTPSQQFDVPIPSGAPEKPPKVFKITVTKVVEINPEVLARFKDGDQSNDNAVATALMALNVVIRMGPSISHPFNIRSFFTDKETKDIGSGITLWRGYFQSVRPGIGRMLINVDISTGAMYKAGRLITLCLEHLKTQQLDSLSVAKGLTPQKRHILQRFISGVRGTSSYLTA
jgi:eukaryotic translation initiation factor 2C